MKKCSYIPSTSTKKIEVTVTTVEKNVKKLRNRKVPALDDIFNGLLKYDSSELYKQLATLTKKS